MYLQGFSEIGFYKMYAVFYKMYAVFYRMYAVFYRMYADLCRFLLLDQTLIPLADLPLILEPILIEDKVTDSLSC